MSPSALIAFLGGALLGALGVVLLAAGWRAIRGGRALATPAERATYETLHLASLGRAPARWPRGRRPHTGGEGAATAARR